ncbi:unnamed protein product, partial [marine sediment metagenome]
MDTKEAWETVLGEIELQISRPNFLTWLKQSRLLKNDKKNGVALVGLPNNFAKEWVKNRYHKLILGSLRNIDGSIKKIDYVVINTQAQVLVKSSRTKQRGSKDLYIKPQSSLMELSVDPKTNLNPRYSLTTFVVGQSNELAHAAVQAVIQHVGKKYNPLFIYGKVGLGKTHLI